MDLRFTREEQAFRTEVRDFLRESLPERIRERMLARRHLEKEHWVTRQRILNAKGWAVPGWPVEYGGTGWTPVQRYIFLEELHQAPAAAPSYPFARTYSVFGGSNEIQKDIIAKAVPGLS